MALIKCPTCGAEISDQTKFCPACGAPVNNTEEVAPQPQPQPQPQAVAQPAVQVQAPKKKNGIGLAGMIVAICGLVFCWVPFLNWTLWLVGLVLSIIGIFKKPKTMAIVGLIISGVVLVISFILLVSAVGSALSY